MTYLPPDDGSELATKADIKDLRLATETDIKDLRLATEADIATLAERMDRFDTRLDAVHRSFITVTVSSMTGLTAIFSLVVVLWG